MGIIDLILLLVFSLFAIRGCFKGLFLEVFSLFGLVVGLTAGVHYAEPLSALWGDARGSLPIVPRFVTFTFLFFAVYLAFNLTGRLVRRSARVSSLAGDRVGGVLLGGGKGAVLAALALFFLGSLPVMKQQVRQTLEDSYLAPPLYRFGQELAAVGKDTLLSRRNEDR